MPTENENNEQFPDLSGFSDEEPSANLKCVLAGGNGTLKVTVQNNFNFKPISGTNVELLSQGTKTTDANGEAIFSNLPPGNYTVKALSFPKPNILKEATDSLSVDSKDVQIKANETTDVKLQIERIRWPLQSNHIRKGKNSNTYGKNIRIKERLKDGTIVRKSHWGWDLEAKIGTPIYAISDGTIKKMRIVSPKNLQHPNSYGYSILMEFNFKGKKYYAFYGHLNQFNVQEGYDVEFGQLIGETGRTGNAFDEKDRTQDHLHFEIHDRSGTDFVLAPGKTGRLDPVIIYGPPPLTITI